MLRDLRSFSIRGFVLWKCVVLLLLAIAVLAGIRIITGLVIELIPPIDLFEYTSRAESPVASRGEVINPVGPAFRLVSTWSFIIIGVILFVAAVFYKAARDDKNGKGVDANFVGGAFTLMFFLIFGGLVFGRMFVEEQLHSRYIVEGTVEVIEKSPEYDDGYVDLKLKLSELNDKVLILNSYESYAPRKLRGIQEGDRLALVVFRHKFDGHTNVQVHDWHFLQRGALAPN